MISNSILIALCLGLLPALAVPTTAQRQMENLTRGIVATKQSDGGVYIDWKLFGTDPETVAFNIYRINGGNESVKI